MMAALTKVLWRTTGADVDIEDLKIVLIFSGAGLLLSLLYGPRPWSLLKQPAAPRSRAKPERAFMRHWPWSVREPRGGAEGVGAGAVRPRLTGAAVVRLIRARAPLRSTPTERPFALP